MKCQHGDAKLLTVKKDGPNKGRQFYACAEPKEYQCDFFEWADSENGGFVEKPERAELIGKVLANMNTKIDLLTELVKELLSTRPT